jgi:hypothetical protein
MPVPGRHPSPSFSFSSSTSEQSGSVQQHPNGELPIAAGNPVRSAAGSSTEQEPGVFAMVTPWLQEPGVFAMVSTWLTDAGVMRHMRGRWT